MRGKGQDAWAPSPGDPSEPEAKTEAGAGSSQSCYGAGCLIGMRAGYLMEMMETSAQAQGPEVEAKA
jgi:hypothetical protein